MKQLKHYIITGIIFVLITGTFFHFLYEWTNNNFVIGFFTPVNESTWEHMKLVFFPTLLFSLIMSYRLKQNYPCIISSSAFGILLGTLLVPVFFYTYTGILGYNIFILDFATFVLSVLIAFYTIYKFTLSCTLKRYTLLLCGLVCILMICFVLFTYYPPDIGLFEEPTI